MSPSCETKPKTRGCNNRNLRKAWCKVVSTSTIQHYTQEWGSSSMSKLDGCDIMHLKSQGLNESESYLVKLCQGTFLSFWSYPNLYKQVGKELCDVLVIFKEHIFVFSDKTCIFGKSGTISLNWERWYRHAIWNSAKQLSGAIRWLKKTPNAVFLDAKCNMPFPFEIKVDERTRFHQIIVAHGAKTVCKETNDGSGSLQIDTRLVSNRENIPDLFTIGRIEGSSGFIHVLDDVTLDIIMTNLDTVMDFAIYLCDKEDWINLGKNIIAYGEEDLLAYYLCNKDSNDINPLEKDNQGKDYIALAKNYWKQFESSSEFLAMKTLNNSSYIWDRLIEENLEHIRNGTSYYISESILSNPDSLYGFFASLSRLERRVLADGFLEIIQNNSLGVLRTRSIPSLHIGYPFFFFLIVDYGKFDFQLEEDPISLKRQLLHKYLYVQKYLYPAYHDFLGLVLSTIPFDEALYIDYIDSRKWSTRDFDYSEELAKEFESGGLLPKPHITTKFASDYSPTIAYNIAKGRSRNFSCPCGSGKKYKYCCGKSNA